MQLGRSPLALCVLQFEVRDVMSVSGAVNRLHEDITENSLHSASIKLTQCKQKSTEVDSVFGQYIAVQNNHYISQSTAYYIKTWSSNYSTIIHNKNYNNNI